MCLLNLSLLVFLKAFTGLVHAQIDLGTAASFGIVANVAVTNVGSTLVTGSVGLYLNTETSILGFPPGQTSEIHAGDTVAYQAYRDSSQAFTASVNLATTSQISETNLGSLTFTPGIYRSASSVGITGTLTLDGQNNPNSLFVFQIGNTPSTASSANVVLMNGARVCNVFFSVRSAATLGSLTKFNGNILAFGAIASYGNIIINGGLYAIYGAVTLINN